MQVRFALEDWSDAFRDEAFPLFEAHWRELAHYGDIPLEPDWAFYAGAAGAGVCRLFTARLTVPDRTLDPARGPLVGYALFFLRQHPHYRSSLQAVQDVLYVDPAARGGTGYRFIQFCDDELRTEGVQLVVHHVKAAHNFGALLERIGYELMDVIYTRRLDGIRSGGQRDGTEGRGVQVAVGSTTGPR